MSGVIDPVLDTSDVAALAALPVEEILKAWRFPTPFEEMGEWTVAVRLAEWLVQAQALAAASVRPGPSHVHGDVSTPSVWGGFMNAVDLTSSSPSSPVVVLGYDIHLFSLQTEVYDAIRPEEFDPLAGRSFSHEEVAEFSPNDLLWHLRPVLPLNTASAFEPFRALGLELRAFSVQTAGVMCDHRYVVGVALPLTALGTMLATCVGLYLSGSSHRCVRRGHRTEDVLGGYLALVEELGLSAHSVSQLFEEGFMPLDQSCLASLTALPSSLTLPSPVTQPGLPEHLMATPGIFVFPGNCD